MSIKPFIIEPSSYDLDKTIYGIEEIRKHNQQRFEMEQLTAVVYDDFEEKVCVGYKDITDKEFWVRGHMPDFALMPGVIMCEAAAQLASFFVCYHGIMTDCVMGLAGLEDVRYRGIVRPGNRFVVQAKMLHFRKKLISAHFQGIVDNNIVCDGVVKGVPLNVAISDLK